jgi:hypothetical protein
MNYIVKFFVDGSVVSDSNKLNVRANNEEDLTEQVEGYVKKVYLNAKNIQWEAFAIAYYGEINQ